VLSIVVPVRSVERAGEVASHFPRGADEVLLQEGVGIARARNRGARRARGDLLLHTDDDVLLHGDLAWFRDRPPREVWWIAREWTTSSKDPYTVKMCAGLNLGTALRVHVASVGPFQPMRRWAFDAVGGFDESDVHEDTGMARRLYAAFGPPAVAPVTVEVLRRFATMPETWERRRLRGDDSDGPYRRLVASR
jgi:glycosyltransferase involved in cell wall biosynthesis